MLIASARTHDYDTESVRDTPIVLCLQCDLMFLSVTENAISLSKVGMDDVQFIIGCSLTCTYRYIIYR